VALIMREAEQREALTDHLGRRRVVSFPSLAHFCTEEQRRQPWLGIIVGYSCAWDAQLDRYVPHTSCITLYQVPEEGHGWPEGVQRLAERDQLDAWLLDLAEPMPAWKKAIEEARKKPRKPRSSAPRVEAREQQLSLPMAGSDSVGVNAQEAGSFSHGKGSAEVKAAKRREKVVTKRVVREAAPAPAATRPRTARAPEPRGNKRAAAKVGLPPVKTRKSARAAEGSVRLSARAAEAALRPAISLSARDIAAASKAGAHLPRELVRLASEIGFSRAQQLLNGLRQNARTLTRAGR
jgi:hypothetical protein